jgi:6-pyruvoyl-tetrahydropterin synthase
MGVMTETDLLMTLQASIHARWGHRVDGLVHTHAWKVSATIEGDVECEKVFPADDLEQLLTDIVTPWQGTFLTHEDVGPWKGFVPLRWENEPTVEEIVRQVWIAADRVIGQHDAIRLREVALEEASEFDRCRVVTLRRA